MNRFEKITSIVLTIFLCIPQWSAMAQSGESSPIISHTRNIPVEHDSMNNVNSFGFNSIATSEDGFRILTINGNALIKADIDGNIVWETDPLFEDFSNYYNGLGPGGFIHWLSPIEDGSFFVAGVISEMVDRERKPTLYLAKVNDQGQILWENRDMKGYVLSDDGILTEHGFSLLTIYQGKTIQILEVDNETGNVNKILLPNVPVDTSSGLLQIENSEYLVTGHKYDHKTGSDVFLTKFDRDGNPLWEQTYRRPSQQEGLKVVRTEELGFLLIALNRGEYSFASSLHVIKTNEKGELLWADTYDPFVEVSNVLLTGDGSYLIQGYSEVLLGKYIAYASSFVKIEGKGKRQWQKTILHGNDTLNFPAEEIQPGKYRMTISSTDNTNISYTEFELDENKRAVTTDEIQIALNGKLLSFDVQPILYNNSTLVPFRRLGEALKAKVSWNDAKQEVTLKKSGMEIKLYINSSVAYVNGEPVTLDSPAIIRQQRTMVPIRFISEIFEAEVFWDRLSNMAIITTDN